MQFFQATSTEHPNVFFDHVLFEPYRTNCERLNSENKANGQYIDLDRHSFLPMNFCFQLFSHRQLYYLIVIALYANVTNSPHGGKSRYKKPSNRVSLCLWVRYDGRIHGIQYRLNDTHRNRFSYARNW